MKTLYKLLLILICYPFNNIYSQTPLSIPYQAIARNSAGEILTNQVIALRFSIIANNISGPVIYSETHSVTTNEFGLFTLSIGHGVASTTTGPFDPTKWNILATFSKVELDANGGTNFIDMGTTQLGSVPFAAVAAKTPGAVNFVSTWDAFSNSPPLTPGVGKKGDYYVVSVAGNTALNGIDDWGVGDWAIHNGTAWEKVDNTDAVSDGELNTKVNRSGDTMTGDLILNADPTSALGGATKQYVDGGDAALQGQFYDLIDSYIHQVDDGVSIYLPPGGTRKRFGIGDTQPDAPLGILAESNGERAISIKSSDTYNSGTNQNWYFGLRSLNPGSTGLNIEDASSGTGLSRLFIQGSTGNIGLGTVDPIERLEINGSSPNGSTGLKILNTASSTTDGWKIGHVNNTSDVKRNGALEIKFGTGLPTTGLDGVSILKSGNVGINELIPDVKLHVTRSLSETQSSLDLLPGTGIVVVGPMTDNIVFDYRGIQARHGEYVADVLNLSTSELNLQRLGGNILIHGDASIASSSKGIITNDGRLGLGTILPTEKLHIEDSSPNGITGIRIRNTAASGNNDWSIGHVSNNVNAEKDDALTIKFGVGLGRTDLMTISKSGNVGINEVIPDVKLHVTRPALDPQSALSLNEGTGILMLGQLDDKHLLMDNHQIQARKFDPLISSTGIATELKLQPYGGPIIIYAEEGIEEQVVITDGGKIGIGTDTPAEKLHIKGRFFVEGNTPTSTIENAAGSIFNSSHQGAGSVRRTGLRLWCSGDWSGSPMSKNIGLYISDVSGASLNESNLAAVLNGNTVIGDITDAPAIGSFGKNVLAIQNGVSPTSPAGFASTPAGGVQLYSASDVTGASIFHLMNGNGNIIKLYRSAALTLPNNSPIPAAAYTPAVAQVIENLRLRINELEAKLQASGLLE